ncbi:PREDICTED: glutamate receptor-like isoform X2 [Priapulus caudatus]|uniref:Glutamate receptor-like isoform X2 n=1 Tax=Priapulus caudatus TaxID=37621 RepID=A0ABM1FC28_PRICU|nr:PREDICTED: glutamate receptor-like isoform X2 [Priapulus caudatus]
MPESCGAISPRSNETVQDLLAAVDRLDLRGFVLLLRPAAVIHLFVQLSGEAPDLLTYVTRWLVVWDSDEEETACDMSALQSYLPPYLHLAILNLNKTTQIEAWYTEVTFTGQRNGPPNGGGQVALESIRLPGEVARLTEEQLFPGVKYGLNRRTIKVGMKFSSPYSYRKRKTKRGIAIEMVQALARLYNFTYELVPPADNLWGSPINGTDKWNGVIGLVQRKEVEFAAGPFTIQEKRSKVVDFSIPFEFVTGAIMIRKPRPGYDMYIFTKPFRPSVWCMIAGAMLVTTVIGYLIQRAAATLVKTQSEVRRGAAWWLFTIYGYTVLQGSPAPPKALSSRVVVVAWMLFILVVVATYSGNLIAFLAVPPPLLLPVRSLRDLAYQTTIQPMFRRGNNWEVHFKQGLTDVDRRIWKMVSSNENGTYRLTKDALERVLNHNHAFISTELYLERLMSRERKKTGKCEYLIITDGLFNTTTAFPVRKGSPYAEMVNTGIAHLYSTGLVNHWVATYYGELRCRNEGATVRHEHYDQFRLSDIRSLFIFFVSGIVLSTLAFFFERLVSLCSRWFTLQRCRRRPEENEWQGEVGTCSRINLEMGGRNDILHQSAINRM